MNEWASWLQRRLMRLLLIYDPGLFRHRFRTFYTGSALPQIPLLQQYDRYIRLVTLSDELLDDIMPRIRRQLSLQADARRLLEEAPTRGDIDWQRTFARSLRETPGIQPMRFDTRLRQRSTVTPENLFTVAVLLTYHEELQRVQREGVGDEALSEQEQQLLVGAAERIERELTAPYVREIGERAALEDIEGLTETVGPRLRPGPNPYRDLLDWWQRFQRLRIGRAGGETRLALVSQRSDERVDAWLYELWIALEFVHLLYSERAIRPVDTDVQQDRLQFVFTWKGRHFRFRYNRQREESVGENAGWEHGPGTRPDYTIERIQPLTIEYEGRRIWREPPFVMDAKYYLAGSDPARTHGPIKKMLGDMTLIDAAHGALFFPLLPDPTDGTQVTRTVKQRQQRYHVSKPADIELRLYRLSPELSLEGLQQRLRAILDDAEKHLPERSDPVCKGVWLDVDTVNASGENQPPNTVLCPKPHIGEGVFDIVDAELHCLKDPRVCHVIGQQIVRPDVVRVTTDKALQEKSRSVRARADAQLRQAEQAGNEAQAEQLRAQIFQRVGGAVEQYVSLRGDTRPIEETFKKWVFKEHWQTSPRALAQQTRNMLLSGEYVWYEHEKVTLDDWAAPAIQYCRALEYEVRRRIYRHHPMPEKHRPTDPSAFRLAGAGWTLGVLKTLYYNRLAPKGDMGHNWLVLRRVLAQAGCDLDEFIRALKKIDDEHIVDHRNHLAHGEPVARDRAETLRSAVLGTGDAQGLLHWLVCHLDPA